MFADDVRTFNWTIDLNKQYLCRPEWRQTKVINKTCWQNNRVIGPVDSALDYFMIKYACVCCVWGVGGTHENDLKRNSITVWYSTAYLLLPRDSYVTLAGIFLAKAKQIGPEQSGPYYLNELWMDILWMKRCASSSDSIPVLIEAYK